MIHKNPHPLSGKTVLIKHGELSGKEYKVEDYWDRVSGKPWGISQGNPACIIYALRTGTQKFRIPSNNEVLYGKLVFPDKKENDPGVEAL